MSLITASTDLTDRALGERSFCVNLLFKTMDGKPQGFVDAKIEEMADYFLEELPAMAPGSRRLLESVVVGVLSGLKGACDANQAALSDHQPVARGKNGVRTRDKAA